MNNCCIYHKNDINTIRKCVCAWNVTLISQRWNNRCLLRCTIGIVMDKTDLFTKDNCDGSDSCDMRQCLYYFRNIYLFIIVLFFPFNQIKGHLCRHAHGGVVLRRYT